MLLHLLLCIAFLLLLAIVYRCQEFLAPSIETYIKNNPNISFITREELFECDNGDLLFLSGDYYSERMIRWYTQSYFSHVALLFRDTSSKVLYVWEADVGHMRKPGPRVMTLEDKLSTWKGQKILAVKRWIGKRPKTQDILNIIGELFLKEMDKNMLTWLVADYPSLHFLFRDTSSKSIFCSELIALTLQKLRMIEKEHHPAWYSPQTFFSERMKTIEGTYSFPKYYYIDT